MKNFRSQLLLALVFFGALVGTDAGLRRHKRNLIPIDGLPGATKASEAEDMKKPGFEDFKGKVITTLICELMKTDTYLVKVWKRADYKVETAVGLINKALARRAEMAMDTISGENFESDMKKLDYKDTEQDKMGRPIAYFNGGKTSLRAELVPATKDRRRQVHRAFLYIFQKSAERAVKSPEHPQYTFVFNYKGWTPQEGACAPYCLDLVRKLGDDFETMFPGFVYRAAYINTDITFDVLMNIIKLALHKDSREFLYTYMTEFQWRPELGKIVDDAVINKLIA